MNSILKEILEKLNRAGFEAYIVGGFVRDLLIGVNSYDVDICTNALVKDILKIFSGKSNEFGSVNFKIGDYNIDITTFREDCNYVNRKPSRVTFIDDLRTDLNRRDFTINTICLDINDQIIDYLGGISDLNKRIIKSVGDPEVKLEEDYLRILRAIRFATVLDFEIDNELENAIKNKAVLVKKLSSYRVKEEISKILSSKNFQKGLDLIKKYDLEKYLGISYKRIVYTEDILGMWAQISYSGDFPFTNSEKGMIMGVREILEIGFINRKILYKYDFYLVNIARKILNVDSEYVENLYELMPIHERKDLKITNNDIVNILDLKDFSKLKKIENHLVEKVLDGGLDNSFKTLKNYLIYNKERWENL